MRTLIVDDEPLARRGVVLRLRKFKNIDVVGECGDGSAAIKAILELSPDVVFLDIQMPGMDGFEVLRSLPRESLPAVIFLTAYQQHAVRAFEVHALDYLLKPVDDTRFAAAVSRAQKLLGSPVESEAAKRLLAMLDSNADRFAARFTVQSGARIRVLAAEHVAWISAAGDYVELHAGGHNFLLRETMTSIESRLDPAKFLRIHRSRIVQCSYIVELRSIENREFTVTLSDGSKHRSSRTYADRLERWLAQGRM